jgi:PAS domain S-box-containing protein
VDLWRRAWEGVGRRWDATAIARVVTVAVAYLITADLALRMAFVADHLTPVWPPFGIALAAVLRWGRRVWPGIFAGALGAWWLDGTPPAPALALAAGATLQAVVAAWLLLAIGFRADLRRVRDVVVLAAVVVVSAGIGAPLGVLTLAASAELPWGGAANQWWVWWVRDASGGLVVAPLLLAWPGGAVSTWTQRRAVEAAALFAGVLVVGWLSFVATPDRLLDFPQEYLLFPLMLWAALRFGQAVVASVTALVAAMAVCGTAHGFGHFATVLPTAGMVYLQVFLWVLATTGLVVGAGAHERELAAKQRAADLSASRSQAARLSLALDAGRLGVWDWDLASGAVQWSENLDVSLGLAPGSFEGTFDAFFRRVVPGDRARIEEALEATFRDGADYDVEFRMARPDGATIWIAAKGVVFRDEGGAPVRMVGVAADVTPRKQLEDELRQQAARLAEHDRRKDEFLAMLGHELRNPLAPIRTAVEILGRRGADRDTVEWARTILDRQVRRLIRLVDDLLDISRITRAKISLVRTQLDLREIIEGAVEDNRALIEVRKEQIEVTLPPEPLPLRADAVRLTQVLSNLVNNAAKYSGEGGHIWVRGDRAGDEIIVRVRDEGVGMDPALLARAFDLFEQGDRGSDRSQGGLGIGLSLARRLVELHGGWITAQSAGPGRGTEVVVRLPVEEHAVGQAPRPSAQPHPP